MRSLIISSTSCTGIHLRQTIITISRDVHGRHFIHHLLRDRMTLNHADAPELLLMPAFMNRNCVVIFNESGGQRHFFNAGRLRHFGSLESENSD
ncbi:hypothetical protein HCP56_005110 [Salmonella enterica subsp. diarizonae]|nr:hypothetical protein [Salmonella enterica subsp. diarizonae]EGW0783413.1 hypothetical protein [Salmonella enterica]